MLEKLHQQFNDNGFGTIRTQIEKSIFSDTNRFIALTKTKSVKICVISMVGNMAGDMVESGQYHIYRGFLNPMGPGRNLLKIFNFAMDELLQLGDIDQAFAETQKKAILANIKNVG